MKIFIDHEAIGADEKEAAETIYLILCSYFEGKDVEGEINITSFRLPPRFIRRDIDILLLVRIKEGSSIKILTDSGVKKLFGGFILNIEVKRQADFILGSGGIFVKQSDKLSNASDQAWTIKNSLMNYLNSFRICESLPLIQDVVFLPNCAKETTSKILSQANGLLRPSNFFDSSISAESLFGMAFTAGNTYIDVRHGKGIEGINRFLAAKHELPKSFRSRLDLFTVESFAAETEKLFSRNDLLYTLVGSPGSGKTVLMLGKCLSLASAGKRCLYLTYNVQLVIDLQRIQLALKGIAPNNPFAKLKFETWDSFATKLYSFYSYPQTLGQPVPDLLGKKTAILKRYNTPTAKKLLELDEVDRSQNIFKYCQVHYVFIDEAQDIDVEILALLKKFYGTNICLAIGDNQEFVKIPLTIESHEIRLNKIYRQKEIPSKIVQRYLAYANIEHEYNIQHPVPPELVGGRSVIFIGAIDDSFYKSIIEELKSDQNSAIDFMHLHNNAGNSKGKTELPHYYGGEKEGQVNIDSSKFRYYHYNSSRGLEANIILYEKIDEYYDWCMQNLGEDQAKKRLFVALTRVKDYAIFTFRDFNHPLFVNVFAYVSIMTNHIGRSG